MSDGEAGLLLKREELELETWLDREPLAELPLPDLLEAATDLERRGLGDAYQKLTLVGVGGMGFVVRASSSRTSAGSR